MLPMLEPTKPIDATMEKLVFSKLVIVRGVALDIKPLTKECMLSQITFS